MKITRSLVLALIFIHLSISAVSAQNQPESLRQLTSPGFMLGAAVQSGLLSTDAAYNAIFVREFNTLVSENEMGFAAMHPARDRYDFRKADSLVNFALANGMQVRGRTSIWYGNLPSWLTGTNFSRDEMIAIMRDHIMTVMKRYQGRMVVWDIVNEATLPNGMRSTIWTQRIGPEYIDLAFQFAREADPNAKLFYNDYGAEGLTAKADQVYNLVKSMVERGIPIDGVGMQMHLSIENYPNPADIAANIKRLTDLGLEVQITEMDVQVQKGSGAMDARFNTQGQIYGQILQICMDNPLCTGFITWGFTDRYTWLTKEKGYVELPLPWDTNYQPKPAYTALWNTLKNDAPQQQPPIEDPAPVIPDHPAVVVDSQLNGAQLNVNFKLYKISGLYGMEMRCSVDPNVLTGLARADGDGFNAGNSFFIDQGFNASTGEWVIATSRLLPAEPIVGDLTAFSLAFTVKNAGNTAVNCAVNSVDRNGFDLPLDVINGTASNPQQPSVQPNFMDPPVEIIVVPDAAELSAISGVVTYQSGTDSSGIDVALMGGDNSVLAQVTTGANGSYLFNAVPAGAYYLQASAPGHITMLRTVLVDGNEPVVDLSVDTLVAGDTDNNGTVDILDASFIGANFNLQSPPAPLEVDLNHDNQINIGDLVLVGTNFGAVSAGQ